jgi:hypothetical protein
VKIILKWILQLCLYSSDCFGLETGSVLGFNFCPNPNPGQKFIPMTYLGPSWYKFGSLKINVNNHI